MENLNDDYKVSPKLHLTVFLLVAAFAAALVLSAVLKVEITARGIGRVVPITRVQVVQPEFPGRISNIHVRNGDFVEKEGLLVEFDSIEAKAAVHALERELNQLEIERTRIDTLIIYTTRVASRLPPERKAVLTEFSRHAMTLGESVYFKEQRSLLAAEIAELQDGIMQIESRQQENSKAQAVAQANIARIEASKPIRAERLRMSEQLTDRGAASQSAYLDVLEEFVALDKQLEVFRMELDEKASQNLTIEVERRRLLSSLGRRYTQRQAEIEIRTLSAREELRVAERRLSGTKLAAPVGGIVDGLKIHTIGGVAQAGDELMRIVPTDSGIEVEAVFTNEDIGFLARKQTANVNLDAFPAERFGFVRGHVIDVSADATELSPSKWGFGVRIALETPYVDADLARHPLRPGMTASVDVITGERRLISYVFAPIIETIQGGLGER